MIRFLKPAGILVLLTASASASSSEFSTVDCGDPFNTPGRVGPISYTNPFNRTAASLPGSGRYSSMLNAVEAVHLTRDVFNLVSGATAAEPIEDLAYTLDVVPNHHRALFAVVKLHKKTDGSMLLKRKGTDGVLVTNRHHVTDCWMERAKKYAPKDGTIRMIEGLHLHNIKEYKKAIDSYDKAEALFAQKGRSSSELFYNKGLTYVKLDDIENAKKYADLAYKSGYPLRGLKRMIARKTAESQKQ